MQRKRTIRTIYTFLCGDMDPAGLFIDEIKYVK